MSPKNGKARFNISTMALLLPSPPGIGNQVP
jgi:hypothetical protein